MSLHMSKVAVGCAKLETLRRRQAKRTSPDGLFIVTRFRPRRAEELVGGSIYWIIKHQICARQTILGFGEASGKTAIRLDPELVAVHVWPKRAHQGWRYLEPSDAPPDLATAGEDGEDLPETLARELSLLALI